LKSDDLLIDQSFTENKPWHSEFDGAVTLGIDNVQIAINHQMDIDINYKFHPPQGTVCFVQRPQISMPRDSVLDLEMQVLI
jgi:hypothetical protein